MPKYETHPKDKEILIEDNDVLIEYPDGIQGSSAVLELNRPKKLNSLSVSMIEKIFRFYLLESKSPVNLIIQKSTIPKAFCAGGDVVVMAKGNNAGHLEISLRLFETEYSLNHFLTKFKKPVVSFMNGIVMGGGVGLSIHTPFRVVTETTRLAMPEALIGFFPDVGATYFYSRLDNYLGWYLCLVGDSLHGYDNMIAGTGTHYVPSSRLDELTDALVELSRNYKFDVTTVTGHYNEWYIKINNTIERFTEDVPKNFNFIYSYSDLKIIKEAFETTSSIEQVFEYFTDLAVNKNSKFAQTTLEKFKARSLISIKLTFMLLQKHQHSTNYEALSDELDVAKNLNINHDKSDLLEGIYKKLIYKTNDPKWLFNNIHDISDSYIKDNFFGRIDAYGHIFDTKGNYSVFPDSKEYYLNHFILPSQNTILAFVKAYKYATIDDVITYLRAHFPQYSNKKGLRAMVQHVFEAQKCFAEENAKPKL